MDVSERFLRIFVCNPEAQGSVEMALAWSWLNEEERQRARRSVFERHRREYVVAHGLLREVLSRELDCPPERVRFARSSTGKPELAFEHESSALRFNLTHARGLVGCAVVVGRQLGFDIEPLAVPAPLEVAEHYFCPSELAGLNALAPHSRHVRFYQLWTLKEAYLKATGLGLSLPLHSFSVDPDAEHDGARLRVGSERADFWLRGWTFARHAAAVAMEGDATGLALVLRQVERLGSAGSGHEPDST